jgi:hypothetical protein
MKEALIIIGIIILVILITFIFCAIKLIDEIERNDK